MFNKRNREEEEFYSIEKESLSTKKNRIYEHQNTTKPQFAQQHTPLEQQQEGEYSPNSDSEMEMDTCLIIDSNEGSLNNSCMLDQEEMVTSSYPWKGNNTTTSLNDRRISTVSLNSISSNYSSPPTPSDFNDQFSTNQSNHQFLQSQQQQQQFQQNQQNQQQQQQSYPSENNPTSFLNQNSFSPTPGTSTSPLSVYPPTNTFEQQQQQTLLQQTYGSGKSLVVDSEASAFAAYALNHGLNGSRGTEGLILIQNPGMQHSIDANVRQLEIPVYGWDNPRQTFGHTLGGHMM